MATMELNFNVLLLFVVLVCLNLASLEEVDWMNHCNKCKCIWSGGKKTADCSNLTLSDIPSDLSDEIRDVDFSNNPIYRLESSVFKKQGFKNIHKLKLHNCLVEYIAKTTFFGMPLIIELDLSKNTITALDREQFSDNKKLRILNLSDNKITGLPDGLFNNMTHLQRIYLNDNEIQTIGEKTFVLLSVLQHLDLANNRIKKITSDITLAFPRLISLNVDGNPWICDCHLQHFRNKTLKEQLITSEPECSEPDYMRGKRWKDSEPFACIPQIIETLPSTQIETASTTNVTLVCKVSGEPEPDVNWVTNGRIVDKDPRQTVQKFVTSKRKTGEFTWNNLTIVNVNYRDKGDYKCVAKNPGGVDEKNISLLVPGFGGGGFSHPLGTPIALIIGLSCGAIILLMLILFLICCCYKKSNNRRINSKRHDLNQSSEECMTLHGPLEMEKALITDVNPIVKPPRAMPPNSVISGGTEVCETKRNLLHPDNESILTADEESSLRSLDFEAGHPYRKYGGYLDPEYRSHLPPDLLTFPPRSQISPAGSSASTVADTTRLPAHHGPQSPPPLHSPVYDQLNIYRTLPYSRSQSPFRSVNPRVPRQGYVTIPRRPRQSWSSSSEPPVALSDIGEPLYDNLGLRTTADGSSVLSLNKIAGGSEVGTPKSTNSSRMFPITPISELEPSNQAQGKLSPSRMDWAKANAEALRSPDRRNSLPSSPEKKTSSNKIAKIPPRPPPKPKKRVSTGPLFEDEGEDGTEV